jgi:hypothetical protein
MLAAISPAGACVHVLLSRVGLPAIAAAGLALATAAIGAAAWIVRRKPRWGAAAAASAIERSHPESRNLVITAEELSRHPDRARPWIRQHVFELAADVTREVNRVRVAPLLRHGVLAVAGVAVAALLVSGRGAAVVDRIVTRGVAGVQHGSADGLTVSAIITPPAYTSESVRTLENPNRIDALQGSRLRLRLRGANPVRVRFGAEVLIVTNETDGAAVELSLSASGYLAIEHGQSDGRDSRRLLPVTVTNDRAPSIRIEAPGKDLLVPDAKPVVRLAVSATDDFGLQSLELRYTKASGSGEQFEFQEGSLPLSIAEESGRSWKALAEISLPELGLAPGDSVIYRVVGRDRRPGDAGLASSETFFIEVAGPGQVTLAGFELPPDRERYALSQQMIVLKLERLRARERSLDRSTLEQEAGNIAGEQRAVRANFVFLMGGTVEDEEEEAEHSHEIQEGRLENTARRDMVVAIQHMGRTERGLAMVDTAAALQAARAAVEALQRAFGRNRYFLRTLPVRSRIDPSRRMTGETSTASDWRRDLILPVDDNTVRAARGLLARLLDLSPSILDGSAQPSVLTSLAEDALAVNPAAAEWQAIATSLLQLRDARGKRPADRLPTLNQLLAQVGAVVRRESLTTRPFDSTALRSAWAEEPRR